MGKKKFIDKKKSATFHLLSRDTTAEGAAAAGPSTDRIFVRVDNNPYSVTGLNNNDNADDTQHPDAADDEDDSIFADAPDDTDDSEGGTSLPPWISPAAANAPPRPGSLPDNVRRQILELGLPDDGYNYLLHLREIKNAGGGSAYYENPKARFDLVPVDIKAYDASRVRITPEAAEDADGDAMYDVASKTVGVRVQKAVDPDLVRLMDDGDLSRFGSDTEDLEEDFVFKANQPDGEEDEEAEVLEGGHVVECHKPEQNNNGSVQGNEDGELRGNEKPRVRRILDEQFDMLTLREYDSDSDSDEAGYVQNEGEPLAVKLKSALKNYKMDDLEVEDSYSTGKKVNISADVIRKCVEYAETYYDDNQDDEVVMVTESSDESEIWDCETIVSTYSNLDNHPGKITVPGNPKKKSLKKITENTAKNSVIELRGKEKLPVEFLPHNRRPVEKVKTKVSSGDDELTRKPRSEESKEEKKERKAALKEERRGARQAKKELRGLYRGEAHRAQKVAALTGPCSIHLV